MYSSLDDALHFIKLVATVEAVLLNCCFDMARTLT